VETGESLIFLGPPGVGRTHLAVGLGLKAIQHGAPVLFTMAAAVIGALAEATAEEQWQSSRRIALGAPSVATLMGFY
jgi:DNA replication protein DnaC